MKSLKFKRAAAFLIDFALVALWLWFAVVIIVASPASPGGFEVKSLLEFDFTHANYIVVILAVMSLIIFIRRDVIFNGMSIGKKIFKIYVGNAEEPVQPVSRSKLIMRNLTLIILPIEVICFLITERRLGDRLAATEVYSKSSEC